jgi:hypothetical protein
MARLFVDPYKQWMGVVGQGILERRGMFKGMQRNHTVIVW